MKKIISIFFLIGCCAFLNAQHPSKDFKSYPKSSAGTLCEYPVPEDNHVDYPKGYKPFYISHYSRHASRYLTLEKEYKIPLDLLEKAAKEDALTPKGIEFLNDVRVIVDDARGRLGDLTPKGAREQRDIALRMYSNFPEVFSSRGKERPEVKSYSTLVVRCVLSMAAFDEGLKECNPRLSISRESSQRNMGYMCYRKEELANVKKTVPVFDSLMRVWVKPERFMKSIFSDSDFIATNIKEPHELLYNFYQLASIMQCVDHVDVNLYPYFTEQELFDLWRIANIYVYLKMGPSDFKGSIIMTDAKPLVRDILKNAQKVIDGESDTRATLRFGHDNNVIPLLALLEVDGACAMTDVNNAHNVWNSSEVCPMGANLQFIFFKNKKNDILVRILHNECDVKIPVVGGPYYKWDQLKNFLEQKSQLNDD